MVLAGHGEQLPQLVVEARGVALAADLAVHLTKLPGH
jgi:hypothetical protein